MTTDSASLRRIKVLHTVIWACFVMCILAIPAFAWQEAYGAASLLIGVVTIEVLVLLANGWSCPLTGVAGRFTDDRRDNFDIYLPLWLARHNKVVFGSLFLAGILFTVLRGIL